MDDAALHPAVTLGRPRQYGGDISRKMKLLRRQAEGKRRMKRIANIDIPRETFVKVLRR